MIAFCWFTIATSARRCTHTSVPSLVDEIFLNAPKQSFLDKNHWLYKISPFSFSFAFLFPMSDVFSDVINN